MNKYIDLHVNEDTLFNYLLPQKDLLKKLILNDINSSVKINDNILVNFKHKDLIVFYLNEDSIEDIVVLEYDYIITIDVLMKLIANRLNLDTNLQRFAHYDTMDLLKNEIINALTLNRITIKYNKEQDNFIGKWRYLNLGFVIDKTFRFIDILIC